MEVDNSSWSEAHAKLIEYSMTERGRAFGTEFTGRWLYSLIRMQRSRFVVELGTGFGVSALWCAQAMRENGMNGHVWTYDGSGEAPAFVELRESLGLDPWITFENRMLRPGIEGEELPLPTTEPIDIVWSDIAMGRNDSLGRTRGARDVVEYYLPHMAERSWILIDNGPPLERVISEEVRTAGGTRDAACFRLLKAQSAQDSTSALYIEPLPKPGDIAPWEPLDD